MNQLEEDIKKGTWKKVYLIYGDEEYLKDYNLSRARNALLPGEDTLNLNKYEGNGIDPSEVIAQADTMPFFADRRVIVIKDSGWCKKGGDALADYLPQMPDTTVMLISERETDKRSRFFKAVKDNGAVVEYARLRDDALSSWAVRYLARAGRKIQISAMKRLLATAGNDMYLLTGEMDKLIAYTEGREGITTADVDAVCTVTLEEHVFAMIDAAADRDAKRMMQLYTTLVQLREPPLRTLVLLQRHFSRLLLVRDLRDQGYDRAAIEARSKLKSFQLRGLLRQAEHFDQGRIRSILRSCADADERIKTGRIDARIAVESILVGLCRA